MNKRQVWAIVNALFGVVGLLMVLVGATQFSQDDFLMTIVGGVFVAVFYGTNAYLLWVKE